MIGEKLVIVLHPDPAQASVDALRPDVESRNRRLLNYKRVSGYLVWKCDFPRTASLKIKRLDLAEQIRKSRGRHHVVYL